MKKKAQMSLGQAPSIVLIVGLVFLLMATFAFVGEKFGNAVLEDTAASVTNETGAYINATGYTLDKASLLGFSNPVITALFNSTDNTTILTGNVSVSSAGVMTNASVTNWDDVSVSYTYVYNPETTAYNTTGDLQTELSNNTSIAGIILTISLCGIVLTILTGVFIGMRTPSI